MRKVFLFLILFFSFLFAGEKMDYGFDIRIREEYVKDLFYPQGIKRENDNYFRLKTSLWGKLKISEDTNFFVRFSGEPRFFLKKDGAIARGRDRGNDEFLFENLYFEFNKIFRSNWDVKIGRQDFLFQYGEGFVIQDGTPGDGSRTFYFNAIKAVYHFDEKNSVDFILISNPKEDIYLPVVNDNELQLNNSDERAFIVYGKTKPISNLLLEPYYIYKQQDETKTNPELTFNTIGIRKVYYGDNNDWKIKSEIAYQWGEYKNGRDKNAFGGYSFFVKDFKNLKFSPSLEIGYVYLSGDDPSTQKDESWDPVFSRWPWLSELYLYYFVNDGEIAKWTNLNCIRSSLNLNLTEKTNLFLCYNYLRANKNLTIPGSGVGKERGHNTQLIVRHKFNKNISGHIWVEHLIPGDFYSRNRANGMFLRWELSMKF